MKKFSVKKKPKRKLTAANKQASDIGTNPQAQSSLRRKRKVGGPQKFHRRNANLYSYLGSFVAEDEEMYLSSEDEDEQTGFHQPELPRKPQKNYDLDYVMSKRAKKRKNVTGDKVGHRKDQRRAKSAIKDQSDKQQQLKKDVADAVNASSSSAGGSGDRKTKSLGQKKQPQSKYLQATEKVPMVLYKVNVDDYVQPPQLQQPYLYQQKIPPYVVKSLLGKWTVTT